MELRDYQTRAIAELRQALGTGSRRPVVQSPTGSGKCLGIGTPVLRYDGTIVPVEAVMAGDLLMGPDSQPRRVLSTCLGTGELFKIIPTKGEPWVCNDVHVLTLVETESGNVIDIPLDQYLAKTKWFKHLHKLFAPDYGIQFPYQEDPSAIPYFLGYWVGDGTKSLVGVGVSSIDPEVREECSRVASLYGAHVRTDGITCPTHHIVTSRGQPNPLLNEMRALMGEGCIPQSFFTASREFRFQFLAGVLDADGHYSKGYFEIAQKSVAYADGIAFIARSLGFKVSRSIKTVNGTDYVRMGILGDVSRIPNRLPRKQAAVRRQIKNPLRTGFKVEPIGIGEYAGFELDGDGRFLLGDFTVTHNTVIAAAIINMARAKDKRVLFCVPALSLIDQTVERFRQNGIFEIGVMQGQHEMTDYAQPVQVCSVQTLARRIIPAADLIIVDECHVSFKLIEDWMNRPEWKHVPFVGLTATPWAKGMGAPGRWDHLIIGSTLNELIELGHLSDFRCYAPAHPDLAGVKTVAGDYDLKGLGHVMDKKELVADIVTTWLERGEGRSTICFAVNRVHAKHIQTQFLDAGVRAEYMDAYTDLDDRADIVKRFENGDVQVICNVGVLTTGFDADVRCIVLARPTKSEILYCLDGATEILTSHGWKGMGEVKVGDCAATMSDISLGKGAWSPVVGVMERDMDPSESWVEYQAPRANFRITDQHTMIAASVNMGENFKKMTASEMAALKGSVKMPTSVHMDQIGVPLTDAELYFIGIMMSDGTWTSTAGSISQSERHPEIIDRIEQCLHDCGIGYSKRRVEIPKEGNIQERHARWRYDFSAGKPKAHGNINRMLMHEERRSVPVFGVTGFRHLLPYLDKDFAPALMQISKNQLDKFLQGFWDGDGTKKKNVDYTPRSMEICSARKMVIDRLQALCAINGYTANMRTEHGSRTNPIYFITITPKDWRSCGGYASMSRDPRPQIEMKPSTNERVWCIETLTGTIITRRNGKVTVMGNCQMIGRGLRTAKGKADCLILDHSDTTMRLGFVTDIGTNKLHDGTANRQAVEKTAPLPKECPACAFLKPPKARKCPACGFEPVAKPDVGNADGELLELTRNGKVKAETFTMAQKQDWYRQLVLHANLRGYKPGWAYWAFKDKFKVGPDHSLDPRPAITISYEVQNWITARNIRKAKAREKAA